jgi:hypothetical protein
LVSLYPTRFEGIIIESGLAGVFCLSTGLSTFLPGLKIKINAAKGIEEFSKKIGGIHLPTLIAVGGEIFQGDRGVRIWSHLI